MSDPRYRIKRIVCTNAGCENGRMKGTRMTAGERGGRRGSSRRTCGECFGKGYIELRVPAGTPVKPDEI
jgi:hypothetical protein